MSMLIDIGNLDDFKAWFLDLIKTDSSFRTEIEKVISPEVQYASTLDIRDRIDVSGYGNSSEWAITVPNSPGRDWPLRFDRNTREIHMRATYLNVDNLYIRGQKVTFTPVSHPHDIVTIDPYDTWY